MGHKGSRQSPVLVVPRSQNRKLGSVAATYASQATCPGDCPFRNAGCYAEHGPLSWAVTNKLNRSRVKDPLRVAKLEAEGIDKLPADRDLRLHVLGDCPTRESAAELGAAADRYVERGVAYDRRRGFHTPSVWAYTHAWRKVSRKSWGRSISVLASCESADDVRRARRRGYAAAVVVDEFESDRAYEFGEFRLVPCPSQTRGATCDNCRLCFDDGRLKDAGLVIGFAVHGSLKAKVAQTVRRIALATV